MSDDRTRLASPSGTGRLPANACSYRIGSRARVALRLRVPPGERGGWVERFGALDAELRARRDGYQEAALAHLTLLLVAAARLSTDVADQLRSADEPLLAAVFDIIEQRYHQPISLADVAAEVALTPGHLTTVVRRKTGRTVQQWIGNGACSRPERC